MNLCAFPTLLALLTFTSVSCHAQKYDKKAVSYEAAQKEIYKTVNGKQLPLYIFSPKKKSDTPVPAVVFFHGGGWTGGSPKQFVPQCLYLADRGMVAITVEYRLGVGKGIFIEDCIKDAKSAMRWVRANAKKFGIDPDRIASGGGSAGGHLAACVTTIDKFNSEGDNLSISPVPNAMLLFNPALVIATNPLLSNLQNMALKKSSKLSKRTAGDPKEVSPLTYVHKSQPPCIMFYGTEDKHLKGAQIYEKASLAAGNKSKILAYEGAGHGFFNGEKYFKKTVEEVDKFLVELGWLSE